MEWYLACNINKLFKLLEVSTVLCGVRSGSFGYSIVSLEISYQKE